MNTTIRPDLTLVIQRTLHDLATTVPGATAVLQKYRLDYWCNGRTTLLDAAAHLKLSALVVASELDALDPSSFPTPPPDLRRLISHIEERFHRVHRRELPELVRLASRVETVHRSHPQVPLGLADALDSLGRVMEAHMQTEEDLAFPILCLHMDVISQPIAMLRVEHEDHLARLRHIERLTIGCRVPGDACTHWHALCLGLRKLIDDVSEHIELENTHLFPVEST